ncbi:hypothetical protein RRG08_065993 [Elysia crispata]|uniref:Uncharacterized protein n=1 Tax=Elysia crispata TaxID=231223 RepID=A0AAE1DSM2_9GAST|nr:hypothetical protein RRG08_065993 [Elysia crispata]
MFDGHEQTLLKKETEEIDISLASFIIEGQGLTNLPYPAAAVLDVLGRLSSPTFYTSHVKMNATQAFYIVAMSLSTHFSLGSMVFFFSA